jgi:hypothetical protein
MRAKYHDWEINEAMILVAKTEAYVRNCGPVKSARHVALLLRAFPGKAADARLFVNDRSVQREDAVGVFRCTPD